MTPRPYEINLGRSAVLDRSSQVTVQYGMMGAEGNFTEILDSTPDAGADNQIRIYNIMTWLGGYTMPPVVLDRKLAILGKLIWGIGATTFTADFDWKTGNQLSIAASFVRIVAAYSEFGPNTPDNVRIGAMLSSGSRAARAQATRSFPELIVNSSETVIFPIPPFAHALNLFAREPIFYDPGDVQIRYLAGASAGFSAVSTDFSPWVTDGTPFLPALGVEDGVRFPETARFVEISTVTVAQDYHVTPCFTLSL